MIDRLVLFVRCQNCDAVRTSRIDPSVTGFVKVCKVVTRRHNMQLPAFITDGRESFRLLTKDRRVRTFGVTREQRQNVPSINRPVGR